MKKFRLLTLLALLMTAATGAWAAQEETYSVKFEANGNSKTIENVTLPYTFWCDRTNRNGELDGIIKELYDISAGFCEQNTPSASGNSNVTAGKDGNNHYITISAPFEGTATVTGLYAIDMGQFVLNINYELTISIPAPASYSVTMPQDTPDASNWTGKAGSATTFSALPLENVAVGDAVTLKYSGNRKVKTVTATVESAAPAGLTLDLATVTEATTVEDGYTVIGTLGANVKISIADGATVTLDGVTINGVHNGSYSWAGINCLGDATIILSGTNTLKGFHQNYPGIYVPQDKTLTIEGSGSLTASSNDAGCGIGGGYNIACGNIVIAGGTITATGGVNAAGIGGGGESSCGNISITGGTITATGGYAAAGIGSGYNGSCGTVTITNGVTSVTATKGSDADYSIGAGNYGSCISVTIGGNTGAISQSPYTYPNGGPE